MRFELALCPYGSAFTSQHLWYRRGAILRRLNLSTLADERQYIFPNVLSDVQANDTRCIAAVWDGRNGETLWMRETRWKPIVSRIKKWYLAPHRVVYQDIDDRIVSWDFCGNPIFVAIGDLCDATDSQVLYYDPAANVFRWQNGEVAHVAQINGASQYMPYTVADDENRAWLVCKSRTAARIKMLVKDPTLAAKLCALV